MSRLHMKTQRGAAALELALILPFLLVMTFTTTEFGRAFYQYNTVAKSVRDAARYLAVQMPGTHLEEARNLIVYGSTTAGTQPVALGLSTTHVAAPVWGTAGTAPVINIVTVRVTGYQFESLATSVFGVNFGLITFPDITATMRSPMT